MDDFNKGLEEINKIRQFNFYYFLINSLYLLSICIYGYTIATHFSGKAFLTYLTLNILGCFLVLIFIIRKKTKPNDMNEKDFIKSEFIRATSANEFAFFIYILPIFLSIIFLSFLNKIHANNAKYWIFIIMGIFWVIGCYRIVLLRKCLRKWYKKIIGWDFNSSIPL